MKDKLIIGLTGGIGTGKSAVASILKNMGITVIDADLVAREVVQPGKPAWKEIVDLFGSEILTSDRKIDRKKLGKIIFSDPLSRQALNEITHPRVREEIKRRTEEVLSTEDLVVLEIPLLIEGGGAYNTDEIWVVYVDEKIQMQRLMARNELSEEEARQRIQAQMPLSEKVEKADRVIYNDGSIDDLQRRVVQLVHEVCMQMRGRRYINEKDKGEKHGGKS